MQRYLKNIVNNYTSSVCLLFEFLSYFVNELVLKVFIFICFFTLAKHFFQIYKKKLLTEKTNTRLYNNNYHFYLKFEIKKKKSLFDSVGLKKKKKKNWFITSPCTYIIT